MNIADHEGVGFAVASCLLGSDLDDLADRLHAALARVLPVDGLMILTPGCARAPVRRSMRPALRERLEALDWWQLLHEAHSGDGVVSDATALTSAGLRGAICAAEAGGTRIVLVVVRAGSEPFRTQERDLMRRVAGLVADRFDAVQRAAHPCDLLMSQVAAAERERVVREFKADFGLTLTTIISELRRDDHVVGEGGAVEVASQALVRLRARAEEECAVGMAEARAVFGGLREEVRRVARESNCAIEWTLEPEDAMLPAAVAHAAARITEAAVVNTLEHSGARRARVAWGVEQDALTLHIFDDGDGFDAANADGGGLRGMRERASLIGGTLTLDSMVNWGARISARLPLSAIIHRPVDEAMSALVATLGKREQEVLALMAEGLRNREIARTLIVSEHTVKFHVTNILGKLRARSRAEAGRIARDAGITADAVASVAEAV